MSKETVETIKGRREKLLRYLSDVISCVTCKTVTSFKCDVEWGIREKHTGMAWREYEADGSQYFHIEIHLKEEVQK